MSRHTQDFLFREDGSPVGIGFQKGCRGARGWARPPSIRVDLGDSTSGTRMCKTINVCRTAHFDDAYETAVMHVLDHYRVLYTAPLRSQYIAAIPKFLARYKIQLKTIRVIDDE